MFTAEGLKRSFGIWIFLGIIWITTATVFLRRTFQASQGHTAKGRKLLDGVDLSLMRGIVRGSTWEGGRARGLSGAVHRMIFRRSSDGSGDGGGSRSAKTAKKVKKTSATTRRSNANNQGGLALVQSTSNHTDDVGIEMNSVVVTDIVDNRSDHVVRAIHSLVHAAVGKHAHAGEQGGAPTWKVVKGRGRTRGGRPDSCDVSIQVPAAHKERSGRGRRRSSVGSKHVSLEVVELMEYEGEGSVPAHFLPKGRGGQDGAAALCAVSTVVHDNLLSTFSDARTKTIANYFERNEVVLHDFITNKGDPLLIAREQEKRRTKSAKNSDGDDDEGGNSGCCARIKWRKAAANGWFGMRDNHVVLAIFLPNGSMKGEQAMMVGLLGITILTTMLVETAFYSLRYGGDNTVTSVSFDFLDYIFAMIVASGISTFIVAVFTKLMSFEAPRKQARRDWEDMGAASTRVHVVMERWFKFKWRAVALDADTTSAKKGKEGKQGKESKEGKAGIAGQYSGDPPGSCVVRLYQVSDIFMLAAYDGVPEDGAKIVGRLILDAATHVLKVNRADKGGGKEVDEEEEGGAFLNDKIPAFVVQGAGGQMEFFADGGARLDQLVEGHWCVAIKHAIEAEGTVSVDAALARLETARGRYRVAHTFARGDNRGCCGKLVNLMCGKTRCCVSDETRDELAALKWDMDNLGEMTDSDVEAFCEVSAFFEAQAKRTMVLAVERTKCADRTIVDSIVAHENGESALPPSYASVPQSPPAPSGYGCCGSRSRAAVARALRSDEGDTRHLASLTIQERIAYLHLESQKRTMSKRNRLWAQFLEWLPQTSSSLGGGSGAHTHMHGSHEERHGKGTLQRTLSSKVLNPGSKANQHPDVKKRRVTPLRSRWWHKLLWPFVVLYMLFCGYFTVAFFSNPKRDPDTQWVFLEKFVVSLAFNLCLSSPVLCMVQFGLLPLIGQSNANHATVILRSIAGLAGALTTSVNILPTLKLVEYRYLGHVAHLQGGSSTTGRRGGLIEGDPLGRLDHAINSFSIQIQGRRLFARFRAALHEHVAPTGHGNVAHDSAGKAVESLATTAALMIQNAWAQHQIKSWLLSERVKWLAQLQIDALRFSLHDKDKAPIKLLGATRVLQTAWRLRCRERATTRFFLLGSASTSHHMFLTPMPRKATTTTTAMVAAATTANPCTQIVLRSCGGTQQETIFDETKANHAGESAPAGVDVSTLVSGEQCMHNGVLLKAHIVAGTHELSVQWDMTTLAKRQGGTWGLLFGWGTVLAVYRAWGPHRHFLEYVSHVFAGGVAGTVRLPRNSGGGGGGEDGGGSGSGGDGDSLYVIRILDLENHRTIAEIAVSGGIRGDGGDGGDVGDGGDGDDEQKGSGAIGRCKSDTGTMMIVNHVSPGEVEIGGGVEGVGDVGTPASGKVQVGTALSARFHCLTDDRSAWIQWLDEALFGDFDGTWPSPQMKRDSLQFEVDASYSESTDFAHPGLMIEDGTSCSGEESYFDNVVVGGAGRFGVAKGHHDHTLRYFASEAELTVECPHYVNGWKCDTCGGKTGGVWHSMGSGINWDLCETCAGKRGVQVVATQTVAHHDHTLRYFASEAELTVECPHYVNGWKCDTCGGKTGGVWHSMGSGINWDLCETCAGSGEGKSSGSS